MNRPKVIRVFGSLHDLFFGDGWEDWTRVSIKYGPENVRKVSFVAGKERRQHILDLLPVDKWNEHQKMRVQP